MDHASEHIPRLGQKPQFPSEMRPIVEALDATRLECEPSIVRDERKGGREATLHRTAMVPSPQGIAITTGRQKIVNIQKIATGNLDFLIYLERLHHSVEEQTKDSIQVIMRN